MSGARKKMEEWNPEDTEVIQLQPEDTKEKLEADPMYRLEHNINDKKIMDASIPHISQLQNLNDSQWSDPYAKSQLLRKQFRTVKKIDKINHEASEKVRDKHSLGIKLLPEAISDVVGAKSVEYTTPHLLEKKRLEVAVKPLFDMKQPKTDQHLKNLSHVAKIHTRLKTDPFYNSNLKTQSTTKLKDVVVKPTKKKLRTEDGKSANALVSYTDSESDE